MQYGEETKKGNECSEKVGKYESLIIQSSNQIHLRVRRFGSCSVSQTDENVGTVASREYSTGAPGKPRRRRVRQFASEGEEDEKEDRSFGGDDISGAAFLGPSPARIVAPAAVALALPLLPSGAAASVFRDAADAHRAGAADGALGGHASPPLAPEAPFVHTHDDDNHVLVSWSDVHSEMHKMISDIDQYSFRVHHFSFH